MFKIFTNNIQNSISEKEINDINSLYKKIKSKYVNIINIKHYSIYDQLCYFIIKNFQSNLLIKISDTDYYVSYKNTDINQIFSLRKKDTQIIYNKLNRIILAFNISDPMHIRNIMWIPEYLLDKLKIKKNVYNNKINIDDLKKIYDIDDYNLIKRKIEKIFKYIENKEN